MLDRLLVVGGEKELRLIWIMFLFLRGSLNASVSVVPTWLTHWTGGGGGGSSSVGVRGSRARRPPSSPALPNYRGR